MSASITNTSAASPPDAPPVAAEGHGPRAANCGPGATASGPALSRNARIAALARDGWKSSAIADVLGLTRSAVKGALTRMRRAGKVPPLPPHGERPPQGRVAKPRPFSAEEMVVLEHALATGRSPLDLARQFGRHPDVIRNKLVQMRNRRTPPPAPRRTTTRRCLGWKNGILGVRCDAEFRSAGPSNRLCDQCRSRA